MNTPPPDLSATSDWPAIRHGLLAGAALLALVFPHGTPEVAGAAQRGAEPAPLRMAELGDADASTDMRLMANWIAGSGDHADRPFVLIDKRAARLYVFDEQARLLDDTPVLLGLAQGDDTVPGIGDKAIADVLPEERTTPAGRFVGERGLNLGGEDVVWVDYDAAVSMHRVRANNVKERRLQRLASETADDNRISYGCINVPANFFDAHIAPTFARQRAMVYVLPEEKSLQAVFGLPARGQMAQMIR